jgi:hypothetical protein
MKRAQDIAISKVACDLRTGGKLLFQSSCEAPAGPKEPDIAVRRMPS